MYIQTLNLCRILIKNMLAIASSINKSLQNLSPTLVITKK